ncbi:MAG: hypothetical protein QHH07_05095 [Sedimentisphaerales bacterium]|jgi:MraZ protein|nr:hypothetical protein [Sedimentisphaerales bacterium]
MLLLTGEYQHVIDEKGRVLISNRLRSQIDAQEHGSNFYLVLGPDGILCLYPERYFERIAGLVGGNITAPDEAVAFERLSFALATKADLDSQGRLLISERLRKRVGLRDRIVLVGVRDHIELWNEDDWERYVADHMSLYQKQISIARLHVLQRHDELG